MQIKSTQSNNMKYMQRVTEQCKYAGQQHGDATPATAENSNEMHTKAKQCASLQINANEGKHRQIKSEERTILAKQGRVRHNKATKRIAGHIKASQGKEHANNGKAEQDKLKATHGKDTQTNATKPMHRHAHQGKHMQRAATQGQERQIHARKDKKRKSRQRNANQ